jgi:hypothetical protein
MIVTLTINPTIDRVISVDRLAFEDRAYINSSHESAGGRGINASSVIHGFGGKTLAVIISGGDAGKRMQAHLQQDGLPFQVVPVENEIRTNLTITDKHGLTVNLNEAGPELAKAEVARVEKTIKETLDHAQWLMVCGSIPPGVPTTFYGRLISAARKKKVKTLLHADGESAGSGAPARPYAAHADALSGGGASHTRDGTGIRRAVPRQSWRRRGIPRWLDGGFAAAGGRRLSHRRGRRAFGGLRLGHGAEKVGAGSPALGRGLRNSVCASAGHEIRHPGTDARDVQAGGTAARGIGRVLHFGK